MGTLLAGVIVWMAAHLIPSMLVPLREALWRRLGWASRGLMAALILSGLYLMVTGWRETVPVAVYDPPVWGRHFNMALMYVAVLLLLVGRGRSRIKGWLRHPMLTGTILWAVGHLLANGDHRSILLFAGLGLWAAVEIVAIDRRDGHPPLPTDKPGVAREGLNLLAAALVYGALLVGHGYFAGVPLLPA
jgi:uncharacterized membrane protein